MRYRRYRWKQTVFCLLLAVLMITAGGFPSSMAFGEEDVPSTERAPFIPPKEDCFVSGLDGDILFIGNASHFFTPKGVSAEDYVETLIPGDGKWEPVYWSESKRPTEAQKKYPSKNGFWSIKVKGSQLPQGTYTIYVFFRLSLWSGDAFLPTERTEFLPVQFRAVSVKPTPTPVPPTATPTPTAVPTKAPSVFLTLESVNGTLYLVSSTKYSRVMLKPTLTGMEGTFTFSSSRPSVATVSKKGVVRAVSKGTSWITIKAKGKVDGQSITKTIKCKIRVKKPVISLSKTSVTLKKGKKTGLSKYITPIPAGTVTYSSSNKKIAKVSRYGTVTGVSAGSAYITVACNGVNRKIKVKVKN